MDNIRGTRHRAQRTDRARGCITAGCLVPARPSDRRWSEWWSDPVGGHSSVALFVFASGLVPWWRHVPSGMILAGRRHTWHGARMCHPGATCSTMIITVVVDLTIAVMAELSIRSRATQSQAVTQIALSHRSVVPGSVDRCMAPRDVSGLQHVTLPDTSGARGLLSFIDHLEKDQSCSTGWTSPHA